MKRINFLPFIFILVYNISAQNITISFRHGSNEFYLLDSIWVTNQRTNQKVKLVGAESLLLETGTGTHSLINDQKIGSLYPNPANGESTLTLSVDKNQIVEVEIFNINGQLLAKTMNNVIQGMQKFLIQFPKTGLYTVSILKNDGNLAFRAICTGSATDVCSIIYLGNEIKNQYKSATGQKTLIYNKGELLHFSAYYKNKNTILTNSPKDNNTYLIDFYECIDKDKRSYSVVKIGNQVWMAENLSWMPAISPTYQFSNTAPYYYVFDYEGTDVSAAKATTNYSTYGVLYNWTAALTACPGGWHLPSNSEWTILESYLTNNGYGCEGSGGDIAKSMASTINWASYGYPFYPGTDPSNNNSSGFSALPGGYLDEDGDFRGLKHSVFWWSSTESSPLYSFYRFLAYNGPGFYSNNYVKRYGLSVRCLKDF